MSTETTKETSSREADNTLVAYKGFDANLQCRGYRFEIGGSYEHDGEVMACESGFHSCEYPLDVFRYYSPSGSRFAVVEQSGALSKHHDDTKVASSKIRITAEIGLPGLIKSAIEYTLSRAKPIDHASPASATGIRGAASATGDQGAAMSSGAIGRVMGAHGNALFLVERAPDGAIAHVWAGVAGRDGIKENVWYMLSGGKPVEVAP